MKLFSRRGARLSLTREGAAFFAELERYYDGQQELMRRAEEIRRSDIGEVCVSGLPAAAPQLIPQAKHGVPQAKPSVVVTFAPGGVLSTTSTSLVPRAPWRIPPATSQPRPIPRS